MNHVSEEFLDVRMLISTLACSGLSVATRDEGDRPKARFRSADTAVLQQKRWWLGPLASSDDVTWHESQKPGFDEPEKNLE